MSPDDPYESMRSLLSARVVAFHPDLARALGGIYEALFFQQIAYWSGKGANPDWIYKTREEIAEETCLTRYQQEGARKNLIKLGVMEEARMPPKRDKFTPPPRQAGRPRQVEQEALPELPPVPPRNAGPPPQRRLT